jgi:hypothetical protein
MDDEGPEYILDKDGIPLIVLNDHPMQKVAFITIQKRKDNDFLKDCIDELNDLFRFGPFKPSDMSNGAFII